MIYRQFEEMNYILKLPKNFDECKKYPVILLLHGAGTRGTDIELLKEQSYFIHTEKLENFNFITVAPQCSEETWFDMFEKLKRFILCIYNERFTDKERFYVTGASMGGYAAWQLIMSMPQIFAAAVPICGGGMYWDAARLVNVPVWAFHGAKDEVVFSEESIKMVNAVNNAGGNARLTIYPENDHNAWDDTYSNPKVYEWLLMHKNKNTAAIVNNYNDSRLFG